jgi:hypothetical protein
MTIITPFLVVPIACVLLPIAFLDTEGLRGTEGHRGTANTGSKL